MKGGATKVFMPYTGQSFMHAQFQGPAAAGMLCAPIMYIISP